MSIVCLSDTAATFGDSVTHLQAADNADLINDLTETMSAAGGGEIRFPPGTLMISTRLIPRSGVKWSAQNWNSKIVAHDTWDWAMFGLINHNRLDVIGGQPLDQFEIEGVELSGHYASGSTPQGSPNGAAITLEFANDCAVRRVRSIKSEDGGVQISGYMPGIDVGGFEPHITPGVWNPYFGGAKNNVIEDCDISGGYLGIELVGGAQCHIRRNTIRDAVQHGLRMAGGGWDSELTQNRVLTCGHTALYVDYCFLLVASDNQLYSTRPDYPTAISLGEGRDNWFRNNVCAGMISDAILDGVNVRPLFEGNFVTGDMSMFKAPGIISRDNTYKSALQLTAGSSGLSQDDLAGWKPSPSASVVFDNLRSSYTLAAL